MALPAAAGIQNLGNFVVMPAAAGIQSLNSKKRPNRDPWIPACAGMTQSRGHAGGCRHPESEMISET